MNTIKIAHEDVAFIAHRGLSGLEKENTNAAFVAAGNRSYFGIETDIHKTADGKFVVFHDETTHRVTNGLVDINVETSTYDEIKDIILPDIDGSFDRQDIRIPLLPDYIRICKKYEKIAVLELKNRFEEEDIAEIINIIKADSYLENVIFISFVLENCTTLRKLLPDQPVQWLIGNPVTEDMKQILYVNHFALDVYYGHVTQELIDELHVHDVLINCWTCDDPEAAAKLVEMGVDYITSNILE